MKCKSGLFFCMILGLLLTFSSCVKDSDISQENAIEPSPILTSNLMLSSFDASAFIDESVQQERAIRIDTTNLELNSSNFFMEQLSKTNLTFHFTNSLEQDFKIDIEFLNDKDKIKYALHIPISSGSNEKPSAVETNVIIEKPELSTFMEATKLVYKITILPNDNQLLSNSKGTLELQSSATYFLDL